MNNYSSNCAGSLQTLLLLTLGDPVMRSMSIARVGCDLPALLKRLRSPGKIDVGCLNDSADTVVKIARSITVYLTNSSTVNEKIRTSLVMFVNPATQYCALLKNFNEVQEQNSQNAHEK